MRTTRQQYLIKQLLHEATSKNLFTQSGQLYQLAKTALQSLNLSEGLATSMVNLSTDRLYSQTVPITTAPQDPNRVVWAPKAADVWAKLQQGQPLVDQPDSTAKDATGDSSDSGTVESDSSKGSDPTDKNSEPVPSPNITDTQDTSGEASNPSAGTQETPTTPQPDPVSGLITDEYGNLIDPETGGIVDPETGAIRDAETGQFVGLADQYLNNVVCAVS